MQAVIGYEEKDPAVMQHLTSGYPRFVPHPYLRQAAAHLLAERGLQDQSAWLTSSARAAAELCLHLDHPEAREIAGSSLSGVTFPNTPELNTKAKRFLQHTGMLLSSRQAEDYLVERSLIPPPAPETVFVGDASTHLRQVVADFYPGATAADVALAPNGMNAFYAAFQAVARLQAPRGRTGWVQLGWLYLDTIAILQKFSGAPGNYRAVDNVFDLAALHQLLSTEGNRIAAVVTEAPTNPLIQTVNLPALHALCRAHGVTLIVDPTLASPLNIEVLPHADVVVNSLTKYAASEGDVIFGATVVNPLAPDAAALRALLPERLEPVYPRDAARLAAQIGDTAAVIAQINRTAPRVIEFLRTHPRVNSLHWAHHPASLENYRKISRSPDAVGSMVSFTVDLPLAQFYDRLRLPKGPSFGMKTTLICPFMYLAHYDLVTSEAGRARLRAAGLSPDLLRLSIGCEPAEDIIAALAEALA